MKQFQAFWMLLLGACATTQANLGRSGGDTLSTSVYSTVLGDLDAPIRDAWPRVTYEGICLQKRIREGALGSLEEQHSPTLIRELQGRGMIREAVADESDCPSGSFYVVLSDLDQPHPDTVVTFAEFRIVTDVEGTRLDDNTYRAALIGCSTTCRVAQWLSWIQS